MLGYNGAKTVKGKVTKVPEVDADTGSTYHGQTVRGKNYHMRIGSNARNYLENSEGFIRRKGKGVIGGHNINSFYDELSQQGFNLDDCIINKKPPSNNRRNL
ncbi:hypothetical protein ACYSNR_18145 [Enterococcus sp. LJL128]